MIFFKKKQEELLPPPPPFPSMELEEEKPKLFDEIAQVGEFDELMEGLNKSEFKGRTGKKAAKIAISKQKKAIAPKKAAKSEAKKKTPALKAKKLPLKATKKKVLKKDFGAKEENMPELEEIGLPETLEGLKQEQFEFPDKLEEVEGFEESKGTMEAGGLEIKPKEIIEAEEEIKTAIEKIKKKEKPSLLKRLFAKEAKKEGLPEAAEIKGAWTIQNSLNKARDALARFDLQAAKRNYIEVMRIYSTLKPEEQAKVYHEIMELYFERKSAEELKV